MSGATEEQIEAAQKRVPFRNGWTDSNIEQVATYLVSITDRIVPAALLDQAAELIEAYREYVLYDNDDYFARLYHVRIASPPEALVAALRAASATGGG